MKLIINISETDYNTYKHFGDKGSYTERIIANGVPYKQDERPKGKWIEYDDDGLYAGECSCCKWKAVLYESNVLNMNFCPNCGADMRSAQNLNYADNDTAQGGLASAT